MVLFIISITVCAFCAVNDVSIPYLSQEKFDGRGLELVKVISSNPKYTRFYVTYMSGPLKISGIMNIPKGNGPYPVIITAHGFIDPKLYVNGRGLKREQDYLALHGYAVLHPDYRNNAESDKDPDNNLRLNLGYTEDCINAVYAIKNCKIFNLDKKNIGLLGHSLGGGVALNMMTAKPGLIKAYVLFAPISMDYRQNFNRWIGKRYNVPAKFGDRTMREKIISLYGSPETNPEFWDNMSAKTFLSDVTEPVMIHQGKADKDVPMQWSVDLYDALKSKDKNVTLYTYTNEPHEFLTAWPLVMKRSTDFFDKYLKSNE
jgi:uncharacterized protein